MRTSYSLRIYQTAGQALSAWRAIAHSGAEVLEVAAQGTDILIHLLLPVEQESDFRSYMNRGMELTKTS